MISIIAVDYHSNGFREILEDSVKKNTVGEYEILIQDNGINNLGHGPGLDKLVKEAKGEYILALDIDAHILSKGWDLDLVEYYKHRKGAGLRLIAGEGGQLKPIRPCVAFFERDFFINNKLSFEAKTFEGAKFDVSILFYFQTLSLGFKVEYFKYQKSTYANTRGNNYKFLDESFVFHHWYGTRWYSQDGTRARDKIDSLTYEEFKKSKDNLFKQYYG